MQTDGDAVFGGAKGSDNDTLDLRDAGPARLVSQSTDSNGNGLDGTIEFLSATCAVIGSMTFIEIENLFYDPAPNTADGIVDGTSGNDFLSGAFVDADGDQMDGTDRLNDDVKGLCRKVSRLWHHRANFISRLLRNELAGSDD